MLRAFHSPRYRNMCRRFEEPQNFGFKCQTGERRIDPIELADFMALYGTAFDLLVPSSALSNPLRPVAPL